MKKADLYIRVSTDEQAEKGYSQRSQAEGLQKYCENHSIEVRKIIFEDHSAKTFMRPSWQKLLFEFKRKRGVTDYILFTKWDRFSWNAGYAYQMISILRSLGIHYKHRLWAFTFFSN
jgi:site-specific DNA recombinase